MSERVTFHPQNKQQMHFNFSASCFNFSFWDFEQFVQQYYVSENRSIYVYNIVAF